MIAEVIIQSNVKNLNRVFDYKIPFDLLEQVKVGSRVLVPFGNMKKLEEGFVINLKENSNYKVKEIASIQEENILNESKIKLAKWMANRYFCNLSECLKLMLPPGTTNKVIANRVKEKNLNFVTLNVDVETVENDIENGRIKSEKQIRTLRFLMENGDMTVSDLELFADTTRAIVNTLCKNGYLQIISKQIVRDPFENKQIEKTEKLQFTEEQKYAFDKIVDAIDDMMFSEFLIYGVTGSRKNRNIFTINRKSTK